MTGPEYNHPSSRAELVARLEGNRGRWLGYLRTKLGADAEDTLQNAYERAFLKLESLRDPEALEAWFGKILRRLKAEVYARRLKEANRLETLRGFVETSTPEEAASCGCVLGLLDSLPDAQSELLKAVDVRDEGLESIAEKSGITRNNLSVRLHRARRALRDQLESHCGTRSVSDCYDCPC